MDFYNPNLPKLLKPFCYKCFIYNDQNILARRLCRYCFHTESLLKTTWATREKFVLNVLNVLFIKNLAHRFRRFRRFYFSFLLCQHDLFAPQTVRTTSVVRLTYAAHTDEALLSPFSFLLSPFSRPCIFWHTDWSDVSLHTELSG